MSFAMFEETIRVVVLKAGRYALSRNRWILPVAVLGKSST